MDKYDKEILSVLLENGKIQLSELSKKTNLSVSSCQRRVRILRNRVIESYQAVVNPKLVGMGFQALVFITLSQAAGEKITEFEKALEKISCIIEAHRIFGEQDYVLLVATPDLTAYQEAYDTQLSSLPNIKKVETTLLMKEIIPHRIIL